MVTKLSHHILGLIEYPPPPDFENMLLGNIIQNYHVTAFDVAAADNIFDPDLYTLKGKPVNFQKMPILTEYVNISKKL